MTMQILRYGALALVSACLVMIALVIGGLVPLESVRDTLAKVPAMVQVNAEKAVEVAKVDDADTGAGDTNAASQTGDNSPDKSGETGVPGPVDEVSPDTNSAKANEADVKKDGAAKGGEAGAGDQAVAAFDVLRVEKDGSVVVAGRAAPNSNVELRAGDGTIIGSGRSGAAGDFVIVPEKPLPAGNYSLSLVMIDGDGKESVSAETATVSVPEGQSGDVLAMVTRAGEASRIVAKPEALQTDDTDDKSTSQELGSVEPDATNGEEQTTSPEADSNEQKQETDAADTGADDQEQKTAALDPQLRKDGDDTQTGESETNNAANDNGTETEAVPAPIVRVEAVEIERDQIFIAGAATPGSTVRIYIDDKPVGEARGTSDNRFLVTRRYRLERGRHTVRADSIDNATGKVIARAEVPLLHEPVEDVAAAGEADEASSNDKTASSETGEIEIAKAEPDDGAKSEGRESSTADAGNDRKTGKPEGAPNGETRQIKPVAITGDTANKEPETSQAVRTDASESPNNTQTGDNASGNEPSDQQGAAAKAKSGETGSNGDDGQNTVNLTGSPKQETAKSSQPKIESGDDANASDVVTKDAADTTDEVPVKTLEPAETEVVEVQDLTPEDAETKEPKEVAAGESAGEIEGAPDGTIRTGTSVIIKPGDNLWRISRKSYGRGIRYTTIYEANRDQIRNPHLIYIGQIFKIPDRPDEELVEADG